MEAKTVFSENARPLLYVVPRRQEPRNPDEPGAWEQFISGLAAVIGMTVLMALGIVGWLGLNAFEALWR